MRIRPAELHFDYLPEFAKFLLENKLDEYVREMIRLSRKMNLPLLKFFDGWPIERLIEISKATNTEFLTSLINNQASQHIENSMQKWLKDQLPVINRQQVISEDITLISYIRKQVFLKFIPDFTSDIETVLKLVSETDQFFLEQENVSIKTYFEIIKNKIQERENLYKQAQTLTHLGNWTWELATDSFEWSEELYNIYELPPDSILNAEFIRSFTHPADAEKVTSYMEEAFTNKKPFHYHYKIITKNGNQKTLQAIGQLILDESGIVAKLFGTLQDITERQTLIEKLQKSESLFKHTESLGKTGSWKWDIGSNKIEWSDELYRTYDMEPQSKQITLELFQSYIHPDDRKKIEDGISQIIEHGEQDFTFRIITAKGQHKTLRSLAKVQLNDKGEPISIIGTEQDITERQLMLEKLQDSEQLYRQAQALAHVGNWRFNINKNEVHWSDELYRIYGLEPQSEQITYESYLKFIHPDERGKVIETVRTAIAEKRNYEFKHRIILRDGTTRVVEANGEVVTDEAGVPLFLIGITHDVTERQRLIDTLLENQMFIKKIADATPSIIASYNIKTGKYNYVSAGLKKLLGYEPDRPIKEGVAFFVEIMHPEDINDIMEQNAKALEGANNALIEDQVVEFTYRVKHQNGEYRWLHTFGTIFDRDSQGHVENVLNISIDITERKLAEQKIKEQEHFIKHIADASPAILYLFDIASNKIIYINHEIKFVLGYLPAEIMEMQTGLTELYHPDDLATVLENKRQLYISRGNSFIEYECRVRGSDGEYVWILVREIIFELDPEGNPSQFLGAALDITERKEIENILSTRNIELQQSNASLEEFAYVASHDLKEPLRKISIFGDRLLTTQYSLLTNDGKLYMDKIIDSSKRMHGLITDLLSVSMISADKSFETYSLKRILEEVMKMLEFKIEEKHAKVITDDLPDAWIIPSQFRQLFQNLINNSLKFVRSGTDPVIKITHSPVWQKEFRELNLPAGKKYLRLDFADNGIGFDNMFANKIFNIFQRLHTKSEYEGTGIGLAICKKIVENHGGIILATGIPDSGSTFSIIIPG